MARPHWTALHGRLHQTLRDRPLLPARSRILIAVSGGQDSLGLLQLLLDLQDLWQWSLAVAHCDHRWRADSTANADHVEQLAQERGLPCYRSIAETPPTSEAAARQWRYDCLTNIAQTNGFTVIATGHTASDRAETLLYNLLRGSGTDGLQALAWSRSVSDTIQLVRPILNFTRQETATICASFQLPVWEDVTNQDLAYRRNRIRQELIPYLQQHFNPQTEFHLAQTAELLTAEVEYLEALARQIRQEIQSERPHSSTALFNRRLLQKTAIALQRRVIRQILQETLHHAPTFAHIEKIVALLDAPQKSTTDPLPGGAIAWVEGDWIYLGQPLR
ncbi:tRNA lysidine(34) synthetase TilS [Alkalinema sp. FACHB-956]|uniref:tRNA lysidine(34) synthetase TilS n=1 Tax=Alkalinema sp. FACHB-956 TaxID=2692768 RepID=UPI0016879B94|nr:tRNA lysidine(34) synthetase TilS [Alkalinema sp. FACHB-956]MBD2329595.1 tRNA lysidine(34) synthetase TilS [Alkalinema sp. FACHB-956]